MVCKSNCMLYLFRKLKIWVGNYSRGEKLCFLVINMLLIIIDLIIFVVVSFCVLCLKEGICEINNL